MRGRKPKPTRLKILNGNPGQRPLNDREPKPPAITPACPSWLALEAKREWKRIVPELEALQLLTLLDRAALAGYCEAWAEFYSSSKAIHKHGRTYKTDKGSVCSRPEVVQQRSAWKAMKDFLTLFGMDPSSRSRLQVPIKSDDRDELERFLDHG